MRLGGHAPNFVRKDDEIEKLKAKIAEPESVAKPI